MENCKISKDDLGDRMKGFENEYREVYRGLSPVVCRLDGKAFHTFTKGLRKPYDEKLMGVMKEVTKILVDKTSACVGYTQSDEITLVYKRKNENSDIYMGGNFNKLNSVLASICTAHFNNLIYKELYIKDLAYFDCRTFLVPNECEACNCLIWRELDAIKNSVSVAAWAHFGHSKLQGKNTEEKKTMLSERGIDWDEYPESFKRGTYFVRKKVKKKFSPAEIMDLPLKHEGRKNPDLEFERNEIVEFFNLVQSKNRNSIIFGE